MKLSEYHHQTEALTENNEKLEEAIKQTSNLWNEKLEDHMYVSECFNFSFDLCRLLVSLPYRAITENHARIESKLSNVASLKERLTLMKREMNEGRIYQSGLDQFVGPLQVKHLRSLTVIYEHRSDRMRSFCTVLHVSVLRPYFSVSFTMKYDHLRAQGDGCLSSSVIAALNFLAHPSFATLDNIYY